MYNNEAIETVGEEKQDQLEFEPFRRNGMNRFRKPPGDQAPARLNGFALPLPQVGFPAWHRPLRVLFAERAERDVKLREIVFDAIDLERLVAQNGRPSGQVELVPLQRSGIGSCAGKQQAFDQRPIARDHQVKP